MKKCQNWLSWRIAVRADATQDEKLDQVKPHFSTRKCYKIKTFHIFPKNRLFFLAKNGRKIELWPIVHGIWE